MKAVNGERKMKRGSKEWVYMWKALRAKTGSVSGWMYLGLDEDGKFHCFKYNPIKNEVKKWRNKRLYVPVMVKS